MIIKIFAKLINRLVKVYWFIFRPVTSGAKVVLFYKNQILMVRQTYAPLTWTFPGGGVKKNEDPLETAKRECREEIGVELLNPKYVGELHFDTEYKKDTVSVYKEETKSDVMGKTEWLEIAEVGWFGLDNLPKMGKNAKAILDCVLGNK